MKNILKYNFVTAFLKEAAKKVFLKALTLDPLELNGTGLNPPPPFDGSAIEKRPFLRLP